MLTVASILEEVLGACTDLTLTVSLPKSCTMPISLDVSSVVESYTIFDCDVSSRLLIEMSVNKIGGIIQKSNRKRYRSSEFS